MAGIMSTIRIPLSDGCEALIDADDWDIVKDHQWSAWKADYSRTAYAKANRSTAGGGPAGTIKMHRLIMDAQPGQEIDHIDGNGLNNCRSNLRITTRLDNAKNRPLGRDNTSGYKGVSLHKPSGKWRVSITANGKRHFFGHHDCPVIAARIYDQP